MPRRFDLGPLTDAAPGTTGAAALPHRLAVPLGGGKDSLVLTESVRPLDPLLVTVNPNAMVRGVVAHLGLDAVEIRRTIDPRLLELNARGAYNGHVPATAVVSAIAVVGAVVHGYDRIAMAVERSASEESRVVDGVAVNHQFSKSLQFEEALRGAIGDRVAVDLDYFSALRPFSELLIARAFARMPELHPLFCSCNRAFRSDGTTAIGTWCADCDKCRFVALVMAPFLDPEQVVGIFGANVLDDSGQVSGFAQLISADKPFECVGERREAAAALGFLAHQPRWAHSAVVRALAAAAEDLAGADPATDASLWGTDATHHVPPDVLALVRATLRPNDTCAARSTSSSAGASPSGGRAAKGGPSAGPCSGRAPTSSSSTTTSRAPGDASPATPRRPSRSAPRPPTCCAPWTWWCAPPGCAATATSCAGRRRRA